MATTDRDHILDLLSEGVLALTDSSCWQRHLDVQGRFHHYSYGNALLIGSQCPEATRVAGFTAWRRLGRAVRRGERAIWILAPCRGPRPSPESSGDDDMFVRPVYGFWPVPVFDIAQTDGDPLPEVCRPLAGEDPSGWFDALGVCAGQIGYSVSTTELPGTINGDCTFATRSIRIECRNEPAQQVKTLAHELAHAVLHEGMDDRPIAELEAESTAFVVCRVLGLDTSDYSFGYVASWAGGGAEAVAAIKASCARIQRAAGTILAMTDDEGSAAA